MSASAQDVAGLAALPTAVRWLGAVLFVVAAPLFLITTNVRQVASDLAFYERGFARYEVGRTTGLTAAQLRDAARAFIAYVNGSGSLELQVELGGTRRALFNQRELDHMQDVQHLFGLVRWAQILAGAVLLSVPLVGFAVGRDQFAGPLSRLCLFGAGLTLAVLAALGTLSLLDFGQAFVQFHHLMFSNDLWILDPSRDYLIMLFPEGFWFDATMRIALLTVVEALALGGLGLAIGIWGTHR